MRKWIKAELTAKLTAKLTVKLTLPLAAALLGVTLISGCGKKEPSNVTTGEPELLFDFSDGGMRWHDPIEFEMEDFPDVQFVWNSANLSLNENGTVRVLFSGMPIWSVYFCDLNGDGKREIISGISVGSGTVDDRIMVCDIANGKLYSLSDRGKYDFVPLIDENGAMCYGKSACAVYPLPQGKAVIEPLTMSVLAEKTDDSMW